MFGEGGELYGLGASLFLSPLHLNVNSGLIIQSSLPWIGVDNSPVATRAKCDQKWSMIYFLDLKYFLLISNLARTQRKLIFNRCVCSYICMVFYGSCFSGRIAHFLHPRIFFQKAAELLHSAKSSCITPILTIQMVFFPHKYLEKIYFGYSFYYLAPG